MQKTNAVVIGAGAVGAMALWQLSKEENLEVVGLEQYGRVHSRGSYAGESRVFRSAYHEGGLYVPMLKRSREMWRELERESGRDMYAEIGTLSIAPEGFPDIVTAMNTAKDFDIPHRLLGEDDLRREYPQHRILAGDIGLFDEHGGGIRPEIVINAALNLAEERGAKLFFNTPVLAVEERADGVVVRTSQGAWLADVVILASGSWSTRLVPELNELLRLQVLGLTWLMPHKIEGFTPEKFPTFLRDVGKIHFFGTPTFDGYSFKACSNPTWPVFRDVDEVPAEYTREELIKIGQQGAELFEGVSPEPVRHSVHHCAYTPDRKPVVDRNETGRLVTITGLSGHGFKFAPQLGQWAAELATGKSSSVDEQFSLPSHMKRLAELGAYTGGGH